MQNGSKWKPIEVNQVVFFIGNGVKYKQNMVNWLVFTVQNCENRK